MRKIESKFRPAARRKLTRKERASQRCHELSDRGTRKRKIRADTKRRIREERALENSRHPEQWFRLLRHRIEEDVANRLFAYLEPVRI